MTQNSYAREILKLKNHVKEILTTATNLNWLLKKEGESCMIYLKEWLEKFKNLDKKAILLLTQVNNNGLGIREHKKQAWEKNGQFIN